MPTPEITLEHNLPNRVRLRFSVPPKRHKDLTRKVTRLTGVKSFTYTEVTQGAVVIFDHQRIELLRILKTIVMVLSLEYGRQPVHIRPNCSYRFTPLSLLSAGAIAGAAAATLMTPMRLYSSILRWGSVVLTAGAILEHASDELRRTGSFDFENLSIVYLINSVPQNYLVRGTAVTWLATFSRHLMPLKPQDGLKFEVIEGEDHQTGKRYDDVIISGCIDVGCLEGSHQCGNKSMVLQGLAVASSKYAVT